MKNSLTMIAVGVALAAAATGCNNDKLTGLNKNPNSPESVSYGPLFTRGVYTSVNRFLGSGFDLRQTEFVAQHMAEDQYPSDDTYGTLLGANVSGTFTGAYSADLEDLKKVIAQGDAASNPSVTGPAEVMQSWIYENLTDAWGDVPYSQALTGDSAGGTLTPAYDPQKDIYAGVMATLSSASAAMAGSSGPTIGAADPIYQGNLGKWEKFSNSLHARMALRLINADPATSAAELAKAFAAPGGLITTNADNAKLVWPGNGTYDNPWSINFQTRDDNRISSTLTNILEPTGGPVDPRLPIYAQPTQANSSVYAGMPNGTGGSVAPGYAKTSSRPGVIFYSSAGAYKIAGTSASNAKTPSYLMTAAEVNFIMAEAAQRSLAGLTPGQAAGFYNAGIQASMDQWGVSPSASAAYLADPSVAYKGGVEGLKQIAIQKWVALYGDGAQAWASWRRTCQPSTIKPGPAAVVDYVPRRFPYSTAEVSVNGANVDAAAARLHGTAKDDFGGMMYWDQPQNAPTCQGVDLNLP